MSEDFFSFDDLDKIIPDTVIEISNTELKLMQRFNKYGQNYRVVGVTPHDDQYQIIAVKELSIPKNYKALGLIKGEMVWLTLEGIQALTEEEEEELFVKGYETFCKTYDCK